MKWVIVVPLPVTFTVGFTISVKDPPTNVTVRYLSATRSYTVVVLMSYTTAELDHVWEPSLLQRPSIVSHIARALVATLLSPWPTCVKFPPTRQYLQLGYAMQLIVLTSPFVPPPKSSP